MRKIAILLLVPFIMFIPQIMAASCTSDNHCFDNKFCTTDKCVTTKKCAGNCTGLNCTGCYNESKCVNNAVPSCNEDRYVGTSDFFSLGSGNCETQHVFHGPVQGEYKVRIDELTLTYNASSANSNGFLIRLRDQITGLTYPMRFSNVTNALYLEDFPPCPFADSCASNTNCEDHNPCTIDECDGTPLRCFNRRMKWCRDNDGCCPRYLNSCSFQNDNDCYECDTNPDCDDHDDSTYDVCDNKQKRCTYLKIALCKNNDRKCEKGCSFTNDNDCPIPKTCGNGKCDPAEDCCSDCGCSPGFDCFQNLCKKSNVTIVNETFHNSIVINDESSKLKELGYTYVKQEIGKFNASVYAVSEVYTSEDKHVNLTAFITNDGKVIKLDVTSKVRRSLAFYIQIFLIILLVIFVGLLIQMQLHKFKKRKLLSFILRSKGYTGKQQSFYYDQYGNPPYSKKKEED